MSANRDQSGKEGLAANLRKLVPGLRRAREREETRRQIANLKQEVARLAAENRSLQGEIMHAHELVKHAQNCRALAESVLAQETGIKLHPDAFPPAPTRKTYPQRK